MTRIKLAVFARSITLAVLVGLMLAATPVPAQDALDAEKRDETDASEQWSVALTPYAWFAAQSSDVGGESLRQSFNDLASITNLGFQMRLAARWRWLLLAADFTKAEMETGTSIGRTTIDLGIDQVILDMKLGVKVHDTRTVEQDGGMAVWVAAGGRYWDNTVNYTITTKPILPGNLPQETKDTTGQTWWDPVLGLAFHFPVTPKVGFALRATGGGFGVGDASDYMWDGEGVAMFRLSRRLILSAGYRVFKYSRTDGVGDEELKQTVTVSGPAIGLTIGLF